jgi:hypothetical protein
MIFMVSKLIDFLKYVWMGPSPQSENLPEVRKLNIQYSSVLNRGSRFLDFLDFQFAIVGN